MLTVERLAAHYGPAQVLFDVSLAVGAGEVVTLLGRNGMGKTTTIRVIMGLVRASGGGARFDGMPLVGLPPYRVAQAGLGLVPEGRQIFPTLTVEENLVATAAARFGPARWQLREIFGMFPRLAERRRHMGNELSGGEQQMLAIGRALMGRPSLLMLDEPSLGLAPIVIEQVFDRILELNKRTGLGVLLVEQNSAMALEIASRAFVLETGVITLSGPSAVLADDPRIREAYLGG